IASTGKIQLKWDAIEGAKEYKVYRSTTKDGEYKLLNTTTGTSLKNTSVNAGETYYYKVKAVHSNSSATSAYSTAVGRTVDLAQPVASVALNSKGKPRLTWNAVSGAKEYEVYRATSASGTYTKLYTTTGTSMTNSSATAGKTYYYKVKAIHTNSSANSANSTAKTITSR
ncbi:MAG: cell wall-binding protein, partial [Oscillospiraceae bacterium]|nr:cell wall-binding protein [Oscillospiraceae bacterium]